MYKKDPKEPIFWSGQLELAWRGPVAGGAPIFYVHLRLRVRTPPCASVSFALCAIALAKVVSLRVGRASLFLRFFPMRILRFMALGER